jgi:hypothetical protein
VINLDGIVELGENDTNEEIECDGVKVVANLIS